VSHHVDRDRAFLDGICRLANEAAAADAERIHQSHTSSLLLSAEEV
jgi:hypothetical protein